MGGCFYFGAMKNKIFPQTTTIFSTLLLIISIGFFAFAEAETKNCDAKKVVEAVKALQLEYKGYTLGDQIDYKQMARLKKNQAKDSYPGTDKFMDGDLIIVADKENHIIVAISKRVKDASSKQLKELVNEMMLLFGEPTAVAHEKIIYWAYGKKGKISDETYNKAKDTGKLEVLATVKLNSDKEIFKVTSGKDNKETADVYVIISSEPLINCLLKH